MQKSVFRPALLASALLIACAGEAHAATQQLLVSGQLQVSGNLTITVVAPFAFTFQPAAPLIMCTAAPGTVVTKMIPTGGDPNGTPAYTIAGGDTATAYAISADSIVVGPNGLSSLCPVPPAVQTQEILSVSGTED